MKVYKWQDVKDQYEQFLEEKAGEGSTVDVYYEEVPLSIRQRLEEQCSSVKAEHVFDALVRGIKPEGPTS